MKKIILLLILPFGLAAQTESLNYHKSTIYKKPVTQSLSDPSHSDAIVGVNYYDGLGRKIQSIAQQQSGSGTNLVTHIGYDDFGRPSRQYLPYVSTATNLDYVQDAESKTVNYSYYSGQSPFSQSFYEHSPLNRLHKTSSPGQAWRGDENGDDDHTIKYDYDINALNSVLNFNISTTGTLTCAGYYAKGKLIKTTTKDENWVASDYNNHTSQEFVDKLGRTILKRTFEAGIPHDTYSVYDDHGQLAFVLSPEASKSIIAVPTQIPYVFSRAIPINDLLLKDNGSPISGGGSCVCSIQNSVLKINFSGNWDGAAHINLTHTYDLDSNHPLPDMFVGYFAVNYDSNIQYDVNIINNQIVFSDHTPNDPPANFYGFLQQNQLQKQLDPSSFSTETINVFPVDQGVVDGLGYQYKYDNANRQIMKKMPGRQWQYIVYDSLDRIVATGPVYSPFDTGLQGWLINKYDEFGRIAYTGWKEANVNDQSRLDFSTDIGTVINVERNTTETVDGMTAGYTNNVYPDDIKLLTINYYDDYNFPDAPQLPLIVGSQDATSEVKGLKTGSWTRIMYEASTQKAKVDYTLYDIKSRPIRHYLYNTDTEGYTQSDTDYDFTGKVLKTIVTHKRIPTDNEINTTEDFNYSAEGRLSSDVHSINGGIPELLAYSQYDDLGQLIIKKVGGQDTTGTTAYQNVDYSYNIRGWLEKINDPDHNMNDDLFAFKINYNKTEDIQGQYEGTALFDGNISETYWRSASDNIERKYGYFYDEMNRLRDAIYQKRSGGNNTMVTNSYNERAQYDFNGNITSLRRNGFLDAQDGSTLCIDNLDYTYIAKSNYLGKVDDTTQCQDGFGDNYNMAATTPDYVYDLNGNMIRDNNKLIANITYNHLDLPVTIEFNNGNTIKYLYSATGEKLSKSVITNEGNVSTDYCDGFQYKDGDLEFFPHSEGYVKVTNSTKFNYVYNYTDHLGNIRLSYTWDQRENVLKILEENHYYPFGLKHQNYDSGKYDLRSLEANNSFEVIIEPSDRPEYQYKYNGKEFQDELGLNWYNYGARNYDPAIGRWFNTDLLAEKYYSFSPYNYCVNNPTKFVDPDGNDIINVEGGVKFTNQDATVLFKALQTRIRGVHFVNESKTPTIYKNTLLSFRKGKPEILHYDQNKAFQKQRRDFALSGYSLRGKEGLDRDEYPYASTKEGGAGADVYYVPSRENRIQGGDLGSLYRKLDDGDAFLVLPVPIEDEPEKSPARNPFPVPVPVPSGETIQNPFVRTVAHETGLSGIALAAYIIISEATRVVPVRNLVPIP